MNGLRCPGGDASVQLLGLCRLTIQIQSQVHTGLQRVTITLQQTVKKWKLSFYGHTLRKKQPGKALERQTIKRQTTSE